MDLKPISFAGKTCYNICSDEYKKAILEHLFTRYQIVITHRNFKPYDAKYKNYIIKQNYLISVKTIGNPYYLLLTKDSNDNNICIFIDKKIIKGYNYPRMIYIIYRFSDHLFNDTLFDGELLRNDDRWCYIINNIQLYKTTNMMYENFEKKLQLINTILEGEYIEDSLISPCSIKLKKYYTYRETETFRQDIKTLTYDVNGYFLSPINQNHPTLYFQYQTHNHRSKVIPDANNNRNNTPGTGNRYGHNQINGRDSQIRINVNLVSKPVVTSTKSEPTYLKKQEKEMDGNIDYIAYFKITKTSCSGIYQLYCEKGGKTIRHSIARVETMSLSDTLRYTIKDEGDYSVKARYNKNFNKWVPIECYNTVNRIDNYNDILVMIK